MLHDQLQAALAKRDARGTRRVLLDDAAKARMQQCIDFSSNDYLSLARSERGMARLRDCLRASCALGSGGSRLLDGDSLQYTALESRIAWHFCAQEALLFNSGFDANVSMFSALPQRGDTIVYDALVHASVHDGMRASRAKACIAFQHNNPADLDRVLSSLASDGNVFLAVESVYSMDGTVCALAALLAVVHKHMPQERRCVIVDEAHAVGVYGAKGAGLVERLGLVKAVDVRLVTFGKALGCAGAAVLCTPLLKSYLLNYARPLIFSTAMPPVALYTIQVALDMLDEEGDERAAQLHALTRQLRSALGAPHHSTLCPAPILPAWASLCVP
ncbi:hypothetical protein MVES_003174 [Malassezia vespertilionis]|uniref:Aminotransferase class I/classII large domain-containing protein n=1 Tax=Malassezia vespertilionis TaxID=2020962 RepID=A0A2N1J8A8_9BASI|nr:hypothetical protein MVES_003174 [Malassezia vespertilionis]